ncbi:MAG: 5'-nucleotidase C-terminal domain-containing protein, partial [Myxococcota bacterium]
MTWTSTRWLCVAALLAATACGDDGEQGPPGMDGAPGADGAVGPAGSAGMQGAPGNDGADGSDGTDGSDGRNALLTQTPVGPGEDCVFGGLRVDSGVDDNGDGVLDEAEIDATSFICNDEAPFTLQLLHFADVDGNEATALANIDEFSALVDGLRGDPLFGGFSLVVSSGDNVIPGPRWFAAENGDVRNLTGSNEPGHVDQLWLNELGVVASALGNHELDQGPGEFADSLQIETRGDARFPGTLFPYLAANVDFSGDRDLDARTGMDGDDARLMGGQVAGSAVIHVAGEDIGLVGVATPNLPAITTTGALTVAGSTAMISELAAAIQPTIDALTMDGIDKIVLLSHLQQLDFEKALAAELTDVDIIVAGGSNTRMGDATDLLFPGDDAFAEPYPFATTGMDGDPLLIVNVDGDYKYLGRLVVSFDDNGILIPATLDEEISGVFASVPENVRAVAGQPIPRVVEVRDAVQEVITTQFENVVGHTDVYLEGRRGFVRTEETNLGNLTADSMKWYAERCTELTNVLAIKNGGGIRAEIGNVVVTGETVSLFPPFNDGVDSEAGDVSEGHFRGTLRFDNGLVILDVTGEELKLILEHGVAATGPTSTPGQFPQVGGISFGYDPTGTPLALTFDGDGNVTGIATPGGRISDLYVDTDANGTP